MLRHVWAGQVLAALAGYGRVYAPRVGNQGSWGGASSQGGHLATSGVLFTEVPLGVMRG